MSSKKERLIAELKKSGISPGLGMRSASVRQLGDDGEQIRWTLTTEQPVMMFDWKMWEFLPEVLLADGMVEPASKQVPLLDSHNRSTVKNILGSVKKFSVVTEGEYAGVDGEITFSSDDDSQKAKKKVIEGHLTDGSIGYGYSENAVVYVGDGQEIEVNGKSFIGPVKIITEWQLLEFSLTPIGADSLAKVKDIMMEN